MRNRLTLDMLNIVPLVKGVPGFTCEQNREEQFANPMFTCGLNWWEGNAPGYTGSLIDNKDGTVTVKATSPTPAYFSIQPYNTITPADKYLATVRVSAISAANGWKMSYRHSGSTWSNIFSSNNTGEFTTVIDLPDVDRWNIGHNAASDGETITFDAISLIAVDETQTPCMTGPETPYGKAETSHVFSASYPAYKGFNCVVSNTNTWVTPVWEPADAPNLANEEVWIQWQLRDEDIAAGMSLMVPTEVYIQPRGNMATSWYTENNPYRIRVKGIREDMSEFVILDEYRTDDWTGSGSRTIDLNGLTTELCRGVKLCILGTRGYDGGGNFHTGFANCRITGAYN